MTIKPTHELHDRRFGRNVGLAVVLVAFIGLVFALTFVKVTSGAFEPIRAEYGGNE